MITTLIVTNVTMLCAVSAVLWAHYTIMRVRAFDRSFGKFAAGLKVLASDPTFPEPLIEEVVKIAPYVKNRTLADMMARRRGSSAKLSEADATVLKTLSEEQMIAYLRTCFSLLMALSYSSPRYGEMYRRYLIDRDFDRKVVVSQARVASNYLLPELCAA